MSTLPKLPTLLFCYCQPHIKNILAIQLDLKGAARQYGDRKLYKFGAITSISFIAKSFPKLWSICQTKSIVIEMTATIIEFSFMSDNNWYMA